MATLGARYMTLGDRYATLGSPYAILGGRYVTIRPRYVNLGGRYVTIGPRYVTLGGRYLTIACQPCHMDSRPNTSSIDNGPLPGCKIAAEVTPCQTSLPFRSSMSLRLIGCS